MEISQLEVHMLTQASVRANAEEAMIELADSQLALIGGGCGEVVLA